MKNKILSILLTSVLVMSFFSIYPVQGYENDTNDLIIDEDGGLVDYTEMYDLEADENETIRYQPYFRSSTPQVNNYLAIMVEFPDKNDTSLDDTQTLANANAVMNGSNQRMKLDSNKTIPIISLKEYVEKYTYNKMTTNTTFFPQNQSGKVVSVMLSKNRSYYMKRSSTNPNGYLESQKTSRERELVNEILSKSKESIERVFSGSQLDKNNDGNVDAISFFIEADKITEDEVGWSDLLWSHKISGMNLSVNLSGKKVNTYNLINTYDSSYMGGVFSMQLGTYGTIIHEYMHALGLPDLYRYNDSGKPVGFYDIMADTTSYYPQGILAYMTSDYNNLGWNNKLPEISSSSTITLNKPQYINANEKRAVKIVSPVNPDEFFIAEYYEKRDDVYSQDTSLTDGIIVYRINSKLDSDDGNMNGTSNGTKDYLYIFRPNEKSLGKGEGNLNQAVLSNSGRNTFGKDLNTTSTWNNDTLFYSDGTNSGITISLTGSTTNSITLDIKVPIAQGDGSINKPYLISSVDDFELIRKNSSKIFKLVNDIDCSNLTDFKTIYSFSGQLDGNGYTIKNLNINNQNGFINNLLTNGEVKNLNFENLMISNNNLTQTGLFGTVSGTLENVTIDSGQIKGSKTVTTSLIGTGSLAGTVNSNAIIKDCYSSANVVQGSNIGGLIGINKNATIQNCYVNGLINNGLKNTGAIIGIQYFSTYDSYNQPQNVVYDINKTSQENAIGSINGSDKLIDGKNGDEGFIGVDLKSMTLDLSGVKEKSIDLTIKSIPEVDLNSEIYINNAYVATYNSYTNKVTAKARGKTEIVMTLPVGSHELTIMADVNVINSNIPITSITLDKSTSTLNINQSIKLNATISPNDTTDDKKLTWTSSKPEIASVDQNGKVTGISEGTATITVTTSNGKQASCKVIVTKQVPSVVYQSHVQDIGWQSPKKDGEMSGTQGQVKQLEAIKINLENNSSYSGDILYQSHIEDIGWQEWKENGEMSGTEGRAKQLEAVKIKLTGEISENYDIYYRLHVEDYGWLDWAKNGEIAGTVGFAKQAEAIEIVLVKKGEKAPGKTDNPHLQRYISYQSHVQDIGWQNKVYDGQMSGTQGQVKQLEAIKIKLENQLYSGDVQYQSHIEDIGWQEWKENGEMSGTEGRAKQLEAIKIKLTGEMAEKYDIYYRTHVEDYGWLGWAKNGASAGTEGLAKQLEAIEIVLVKKGGSAPGSTTNPFIKK